MGYAPEKKMIDGQFCYKCSTGTIDSVHWWIIYMDMSVEDKKKCLACPKRMVD